MSAVFYVPDGERAVFYVPDGERAVVNVPDGDSAVVGIPDGGSAVVTLNLGSLRTKGWPKGQDRLSIFAKKRKLATNTVVGEGAAVDSCVLCGVCGDIEVAREFCVNAMIKRKSLLTVCKHSKSAVVDVPEGMSAVFYVPGGERAVVNVPDGDSAVVGIPDGGSAVVTLNLGSLRTKGWPKGQDRLSRFAKKRKLATNTVVEEGAAVDSCVLCGVCGDM
ncbi:hypothetical protein PoB_006765000 [Plakobranchus ocellatus]|uniref:Uncharacterized protein n=1 Tax=Plakobranchus ocellatus TaxID=259542 RepID=A0AAV4DB22_9GAST|nr:hypothetical protein PoB_006765000 [Plakobranchus ocellatus]